VHRLQAPANPSRAQDDRIALSLGNAAKADHHRHVQQRHRQPVSLLLSSRDAQHSLLAPGPGMRGYDVSAAAPGVHDVMKPIPAREIRA
jgi:hypothetical protein